MCRSSEFNDSVYGISRRDALRWILMSGSALGVAALTGCIEDFDPARRPTSGSIAVATGCYASSYAGANVDQMGCGIVQSFGNQVLDQKFAQEVQIQSIFWGGVPARVQRFDECSAANANAAAFPNGNILIGYWMAQQILQRTNSDLPIAGVLAHEWGHQVQFRFNYISHSDPTRRRAELEADAFSGYFMGLAKGWTGRELEIYLDYMASIGDTNFNDLHHHGTPAERRAASALGMEVASRVIDFQQPLSYDELHHVFTNQIARFVMHEDPPLSLGLTAAAGGIMARIDTDLLAGIFDGTRSVEELAVPSSTESERRPFFPS